MKKEIYWNLFFSFIIFSLLIIYYLFAGVGTVPIKDLSREFASLNSTILIGIGASLIAAVGMIKGGKPKKTRQYVIRILYEINFVLLACISLFFASYSEFVFDDYLFISVLFITMTVLIFDMLRLLKDLMSNGS